MIKIWAAVCVMLKHYIRFAQMRFEKLAPVSQEQNAAVLRVFQRILGMAEFFEPVILFFVVSGFLTAASLERSESGRTFLKRRFRRLYPELWLSAIVYLAVLMVTVPELLDRSMLKWAAAQVLGIAYTPACLKEYATGSVNGALWMIFVLVQMYLLLALLQNRLRKLSGAGWCGVFAICIGGNILSRMLTAGAVQDVFPQLNAVPLGNTAGKVLERLFVPYALWYFIGVFCFRFKDTVIPFCRKYGWLCLSGTVLIQAAAGRWIPGIWSYGYYCGIGEGSCAAAAAILAAFSFPSLRVRRDITYEIFLYHWLFLNLWVAYDLIWNHSPAVMLVSFLAVSIAMAFVMHMVYKLTPGSKI